MKKIIATLVVMLLVAGSVSAGKRDTRWYHPTAKGEYYKILKVAKGTAHKVDKTVGDVVGRVHKSACGAMFGQHCIAVSDPEGPYRLIEASEHETQPMHPLHGGTIRHVDEDGRTIPGSQKALGLHPR